MRMHVEHLRRILRFSRAGAVDASPPPAMSSVIHVLSSTFAAATGSESDGAMWRGPSSLWEMGDVDAGPTWALGSRRGNGRGLVRGGRRGGPGPAGCPGL